MREMQKLVDIEATEKEAKACMPELEEQANLTL